MLTPTRRAVFATTILAWVGLCGLVLHRLVRHASEAAAGALEDYARTPSFQVLNFVVGYLPGLVLILCVVLGAEWAAYYIAWRSRRRASVDGR